MARLRTLKPGFFSNEMLAEVPPLGRLLFQGLWCIADRAGRLEDRPRKIKAEVLPYDDADADELLQCLSAHGFILRYAAGEQRFIQIVNFDKHQSPHKMEAASIIPAPDDHDTSTLQAPDDDGLIVGSGILELNTPLPPAAESTPKPVPVPTMAAARPVRGVPKPRTLNQAQQGRFDRWYAAYPRHEKRPEAEAAFRRLDPDEAMTERLITDVGKRKQGRKWLDGYIDHPSTYLNQHVWDDDIEPPRLHALPHNHPTMARARKVYD